MEIAVLVKQVPATESIIQVSEDKQGIDTEALKWILNPYDEIAVEEALKIRETHGGKVTVVSFGPRRAEEAIRTALAMGADEGVLVEDEAGAAPDALHTARILAAAVEEIPHDLILAGLRAVDYDYCQVGGAVAGLLDIPQMTQAVSVAVDGGKATCRCVVDGGAVDLCAPLPVLITAQRGLNEPRYPSLPGIMKAKKKPLAVKSARELLSGGNGSGESGRSSLRAVRLHVPETLRAGRILAGGEAAQTAADLVSTLKNDLKVLAL